MTPNKHPTYTSVLEAETVRVERLLASLIPGAWDRPTPCDRWDVATVVAHLTGAADAFAERVRQGLVGDVAPPPGLPEPGAVNAGSWSQANADRWRAFREGMGSDLPAAFTAAGRRFNRLIADLTPEQWDLPCYHPGGVISVRTLVGLRTLELAVHGWDIGAAVNPPAPLSRECLPVLVEFISDYLQWFFTPGEALPRPGTCRFRLTGSPAVDQDIVVQGETARMEPAGAGAADVTFRSTSETFVLLLCGRLSWGATRDEGLLSAEGDLRLADEFGRWFRGA